MVDEPFLDLKTDSDVAYFHDIGRSARILSLGGGLATTPEFQKAIPPEIQEGLVRIYHPKEMAVFYRGEGGRMPHYTLARKMMTDFLDSSEAAASFLSEKDADLLLLSNKFSNISARAIDLGLVTFLIEHHLQEGSLKLDIDTLCLVSYLTRHPKNQ